VDALDAHVLVDAAAMQRFVTPLVETADGFGTRYAAEPLKFVLAVDGTTADADGGEAGLIVEEQPARPSTKARTAVANLIVTARTCRARGSGSP
jgi:hypothetical protein